MPRRPHDSARPAVRRRALLAVVLAAAPAIVSAGCASSQRATCVEQQSVMTPLAHPETATTTAAPSSFAAADVAHGDRP